MAIAALNALPPYPWQGSAWAYMAQCHAQAQMPTAILCYGALGTGQWAWVRAVAQACLCTAPGWGSCGKCPACQWYLGGVHPDAWEIVPNAQGVIPVESIRTLQQGMTHTAMYGYKVVSIDQPETMTLAAANAFLKMLEEPPGHTFIQLCSYHPYQLLPTIRSRCVPVSFGRPDPTVALAWLTEMGVAEPARWLAWARGAPCLAQTCALDTQYLSQIQTIAAAFHACMQGEKLPQTYMDAWQAQAATVHWTVGHILQQSMWNAMGMPTASTWITPLAGAVAPRRIADAYLRWQALTPTLPKLPTEAWFAQWQEETRCVSSLSH